MKFGSLVTKMTPVAVLLFMVLFVLFMYTFLHEAGHALTGLAFGQELSEFNIDFWTFNAHVELHGDLSQTQRAIQSIAGAGLPLLIWFLSISIVPRKAGLSLEVLKLVASMAVINTLLVWMIIPVLYLFGLAPSDDVTYFLRYSQIQPLLLLGLALGLYIGGWGLFLAKIDGLRHQFLLFKQIDSAVLAVEARTAIPVMTGVILLCTILIFTANTLGVKDPAKRFSPPQGFRSVAQIDLASKAYQSETLAEFSLVQDTYVGVFIAVRNIDTRYFDLSISGPDGFKEIVLHGEGYRANQDGGLWEKNLRPGKYQLVMTSNQNPGIVTVYMQVP